MSWLTGLRVRLRGWLFRDRVERELQEELRWHLDMETEKNIREGMSPAAARREAYRRFGGVERTRDMHRDVRGMRQVERFLYDLRYASGGLLRSRSFAAAAVLTLALGIGANAAAFGMVNALLYRPPPGVGEPDGLHRVRIVTRVISPDGSRQTRPIRGSYPLYGDLRDRTEGLADLSAYQDRAVIEGHGAGAREVRALYVSASYFSTLRVEPAIGRFWTVREDREAESVVVLSHGFWERRFGGESDVIGRSLELAGAPVTVIGVAPRHFRGIDLDPVDVWLPMGLRGPELLEARNTVWLWMVGRPAPGVTPDVAEARGTRVMREIAREYPDSYHPSEAEVDLAPVADPFGGYGRERPVPVWLLGVTGVVLLIACANVSSLLLARGAGRRRELAVRTALGASRGRIVQLLLVESLLLALLGGGVGLLLARGSAELFPLLGVPPLDPFLDVRVATFAFSVALATTVIVGLVPALRASRTDVERELTDGAPRAGHDRSRLRAGLTVVQIALSIVLLVNAGLFVRSLRNVRVFRPGVEPERLATVSVRFPSGTPPERHWEVKEAALDRMRALPGVTFAELADGAPLAPAAMVTLDPGSFGLPADEPLHVVSLNVGPEYFGTVGVEVLAGRPFDFGDGQDSATAVIVNSTLAQLLGGEREAVGRCIPWGEGECRPVVGVVADSRFFDPTEDPLPAMYRPLSRTSLYFLQRAFLLVRTDDRANELSATFRAEITALAPDVRLVEVESMADRLAPLLQPWRIATIIFTLFGGMAFLLAAVGLHGVVSYLVTSRTHELGVRVALGARPSRVLGLVVREGAWLAALGAGIGIAVTPGVAGLLEHRMYGVSPADPGTYAVVVVLVAVVSLAATLVSAGRAVRVDPAVALRAD